MEKLLAFVLLLAGMSTATFAQESEGLAQSPKKMRKKPRMEKRIEQLTPEKIAERKTEHLSERLALTATQRDEIYAIQLEHAQKMAAYRSDKKEHQNKLREERMSSHEKMRAVLTPEQQEQLKESNVERSRGSFRNTKRGLPKKEKKE